MHINSYLDKLTIFLCCIAFYIFNVNSDFMVIYALLAIITCCLMWLFPNINIKYYLYFIYFWGCIIKPDLLYFIPLVSYDVLEHNRNYTLIFPFILFFTNIYKLTPIVVILLSFLTLATYLLKLKTSEYTQLKKKFNEYRDTSVQNSSILATENRNLLEKQDYEINMATLNERNRIAREIHDNIGHILSRSILQVGALIAITKDSKEKEQLLLLKEALSSGMDSIRNSIHNIHEDSMNLYDKLMLLINDFSFCRVNFEYNVDNDFNMKTKYTILYIVKEALSNVIKHSNATDVSIKIYEHPALYQIIVVDNGDKFKKNYNNFSMGLNVISERVSSLSGTINITTEKGFCIFISIPKENALSKS